MITPSNVMSESSVQSQGITSASIPAARLLYWSLRRELWEIRALYVAPVTLAAIFLFGFLISILHLLGEAQAVNWLDPAKQRELFSRPFEFAEDMIMAATLIVAMFYSVEALHAERRDRSILFWKSLPVSDLITVLSKAAIPILVLPLITFGITVLTQSIMLLMSSTVLLISGHGFWTLWSRLPVFQVWVMLFFHLIGIHGLWQSPIYGWLLFISGWARRVPILWAVLPPLAIGFGEKVAFNTTHFGNLIGSRFTGGPEGTAIMQQHMSMTMLAPAHFLLNPGLWIGFLFTAAFLTAAVRIRRYRGPI